MVKRSVGSNAFILQAHICLEYMLDARELEGQMMHPGMRNLIRVILDPRDRQQRHSVVGLVIRHPGSHTVAEVGHHTNDLAVPLDHLVQLRGLEGHVVENWLDFGHHGRLSPRCKYDYLDTAVTASSAHSWANASCFR